MKTLDLRGLSEAERDSRINEAVAVHVAGYVLHAERQEPPCSKLKLPEKWCWQNKDGFWLGEPYPLAVGDDAEEAFKEIGARWGYMWARPKFTTSADAMLPLLEKRKGYEVRWCYDYPKKTQCEITVFRSLVAVESYRDKVCCGAPTFPLAACYALLKANRVEILINPT